MGLDFLQLISPVWTKNDREAAGGEKKRRNLHSGIRRRAVMEKESELGRVVRRE